jgi:hypothetical protein
MAWKAEVQVISTGAWSGNRLLFETKEEAESYGVDLSHDQPGVLGWRVLEDFGDPNYTWKQGKIEPIPGRTL